MKRESGFTLVEVLVAASVLAIVATALFGLLSRSLSNLRKVEELHQYELATVDVMNRILSLPALPPSATAQGSLNTAGGRWTATIDPWAPPTLEKMADQAVVRIHVVVTWPGQSSQRSIDVESLKVAKIQNYDLQSAIATIYPQ
jgi:type II secretion system protein I